MLNAPNACANPLQNHHFDFTLSAKWLQVRLMLATVGRGGDGQKIRDEILQIMHRHHIPEKKVRTLSLERRMARRRMAEEADFESDLSIQLCLKQGGVTINELQRPL